MFSGIFNYDNPFWRTLGRVGDLIVLHFLWLFCCIPLVTIGASTTALHYCTLKMVRNEDNNLLKQFFKSFRQNLLQGICTWMLLILVFMVLVIDTIYFGGQQSMPGGLRFLLRGFAAAMLLLWCMVFLYVWPVLAHFENSIFQTIRNAALMALQNLGRTILMLLMDVAIVAIVVLTARYLPGVLPLFLLMGYAMIAMANSAILSQVFKKYEA